MVTYTKSGEELIWKALADDKRRMIVDALSREDMTTGALVELVPGIGRTAVLKHIDVLHAADLVRFRREGRNRWNQLNTKPLARVCAPWVMKHMDRVTASAIALKKLAESTDSTRFIEDQAQKEARDYE